MLLDIETDDARVRFFHKRPGAARVLGEQIPSIFTVGRETIRIIIAAAPFEKRIVRRARRHGIIDRLGRELSKLREAAGPAEGNFSTVWTAPVVWIVVKEISLQPLDIVAIGLDKAHSAAAIIPIDR